MRTVVMVISVLTVRALPARNVSMTVNVAMEKFAMRRMNVKMMWSAVSIRIVGMA
jgi:hypothetical protein